MSKETVSITITLPHIPYPNKILEFKTPVGDKDLLTIYAGLDAMESVYILYKEFLTPTGQLDINMRELHTRMRVLHEWIHKDYPFVERNILDKFMSLAEIQVMKYNNRVLMHMRGKLPEKPRYPSICNHKFIVWKEKGTVFIRFKSDFDEKTVVL